ncbi:hypothetical protein F5Y18DRAFT_73746 [Xylariaceae sp. FL1019]|nr:hypothetical protein F5Y18DRAFT_73746 [Xylariaceae sp. FL1019]
MFGALANLAQPSAIVPPPKIVPPPTPVRLPQCNPQLPVTGEAQSGEKPASLVRFLQSLHRPTELDESHFAALGVHVHADAPSEDVVPDPAFLPPTSEWDGIGVDEAKEKDDSFRTLLSNGKLSPEARVYIERRSELSIVNQTAFRTIRRIKPEPGKQAARLGNCYEFFKQMELMATYWDDTSLSKIPARTTPSQSTPSSPPPRIHPIDSSLEQVGHAMIAAAFESNTRSEPDSESQKSQIPERVTYRTSPGSQMPAEFRHAIVAAFVKLVTYDFGCTLMPPRAEPRLHILEPPLTSVSETGTSKSKTARQASQRASYFPSGCVFTYRFPTTREAARAGIVEGPLVAISARNTTSFFTPMESRIDFGRELVAALVTAQHRAREGKTEKRFGEDKWWATAKRWGGGEGGAIGREVEGDSIVGDKDAGNVNPGGPAGEVSAETPPEPEPTKPSGIPFRGPPMSKKARKTMSMYDRYRMVRLPASNWDKKARYEAIGKAPGKDYDDVFVISSLFHHLSVLRVRVPNRLLEVLDGAPGHDPENEKDGSKARSWGKLEIWRSKWFDLFQVEERLEAMRLIWGMMAWAMRKTDGGGDAAMKDT